MKKILRTTISLCILFLLNSTLTVSANRAPFQAVPILPENQISDRAFYDIQIAHNKTQDLYLVLKNDTLEEINVMITAITATTDAGGRVLYSQKGYTDRSIKYPFETLVTPNPSVVTVPALTEIETSVRLNSPASRYEGIVLGALHITTIAKENDFAGIVNLFAYSLAVRLTSDPAQIIVPDIKFEGAQLLAGERSTGFILDIRNIVPELYRYAELTVDVHSNETTVFSNTTLIDFAPNSFYPLTLTANKAIPPGIYTADATLRIDDDIFYYTGQFNIHENDSNADKFLEQLLPQREGAPGAHLFVIKWWMWLLLLLFLSCLFFIAILIFRQKRKNDNTTKHRRTK